MPTAFTTRMRQQLGTDFARFEQSLNLPSPVSIRTNPLKTFDPLPGTKVPWAPNGLYLSERPSFTLDPRFHAGAYYVQEASSMFLEHAVRCAVDFSKPLLALDLCAAPGGKSTNLLSTLPVDAFLISNEVIRSRSAILSENLQKWGYPNVMVTNNDPHHFHSLEGVFDLVVVDAPCSGEGLFRKDPEASSEWSEANVELCAQRQQRIVSDIWPALKEGGVLIYSTCTYNRIENEENLQWLKQNYSAEFVCIPVESAWGIQEIQEDGVIGYRFYPHLLAGEGFFISVVRKTSKTNETSFKSRTSFTALPEKRRATLSAWLTEPDRFQLIIQNELVIMLPRQWMLEIQYLSQVLSVITKGTAVAIFKHEKAIPEHAFALSVFLNQQSFVRHELSKEDAWRYLRKDVFEIPSDQKGFQLISYHQLPLGWINHLGNRVNNLYPIAWRIKMIL